MTNRNRCDGRSASPTVPVEVERLRAVGVRVGPLHTAPGGVCTCGTPGCPSPGKHPRTPRGHHDFTDRLDSVTGWAVQYPGCNWGARPDDGVVVLDIDPRNGGDDTLAALVTEHGPLPSTRTARTGGGGRHYWFTGTTARTKIEPGIDIKSASGFVVIPPSVHASGQTYAWIDGSPVAPAPAWLAELPGRSGSERADDAAVAVLRTALATDERYDDDPCAAMAGIAGRARVVVDDGGSRHNAVVRAVTDAVELAALGHHGLSGVLAQLRELLESNPKRDPTPGEFPGIVTWAMEKVAAGFGGLPGADPCVLSSVLVASVTGAPPPTTAKVFDPHGVSNDQGLAAAVADAMVPVLRYARDAQAWVMREGGVWALRSGGEPAAWIITELAQQMPYPQGEELTGDQRAQRDRWGRFHTQGASAAIASKLRALVAGPGHRASLRLTELDTDPAVLWTPGGPVDLCTGGWAAVADPDTPHLHCAGYTPDLTVAAPAWDVFTAAVWPDPAVRSYALDVLAVALTGVPDAVLPILFGPERTGKSATVGLLAELLGTYAVAADPRLITAGGQNAHASIVFALKGTRLAFVDEGPGPGRVARESLKKITGGIPLTGNPMRGNPVTFAPTHTLVMMTNDEPAVADPALRSRVRLLPCEGDPVAVRSARRALVTHREAPGILAGLVARAGAYLADPDRVAIAAAPESIRRLGDEITAEQDPVAVFYRETGLMAVGETDVRELHRVYVSGLAWHPMFRHTHHAREPLSVRRFGHALSRLGVGPARESNGRSLRPVSFVGLPVWPRSDPLAVTTPGSVPLAVTTPPQGGEGPGESEYPFRHDETHS